jgi:hypothetical protein
MGGFKLLDYKGKEIAYFDYRGMNENERIEMLDRAVLSTPEPYQYILTDFRVAFILPSFLKRVKEVGKENRQYVKKAAVLGVTGTRKVLLKFFNLFTQYETVPFESFEEAREWLVQD